MSTAFETITYIGGKITMSVDDNATIDMFGLTVAQVHWEMSHDLVAAFELQWTKLKPHPTRNYCFLTELVQNKGRSYVKYTGTFKGVRDIAMTAPQVETDTEELTVTLKLPNGTTTQLRYIAPTTTYRYSMREYPTKRQFAGKMKSQSDAYTVRERTGDIDASHKVKFYNGNESITNVGGALDTTYLAVKGFIVNTTFNPVQVGNCWTITEKNRGEIVDIRSNVAYTIVGNQLTSNLQTA